MQLNSSELNPGQLEWGLVANEARRDGTEDICKYSRVRNIRRTGTRSNGRSREMDKLTPYTSKIVFRGETETSKKHTYEYTGTHDALLQSLNT